MGERSGSDNGITGEYGVTGDSQGNGWFSHFSSDVEAKADVETGKVTEIKLPRRPDNGLFSETEKKVFNSQGESGFNWGTPWAVGPRRPGGDKHGDSIWVPGWWDHKLTKIDIGTLKLTQYEMPSPDFGAYMAQVDNHHNVWMNYQNSGTVSKFDPSSGKWTVYSLPTPSFDTHEIGILDHGGPIQVAVACIRSSKLARLQFRSQADMNALKAEAQQLTQQQMASNR
jgi:streptogramin lyase